MNRLLDIVIALVLIILLAPVFVGVAIAVYFKLGRQVIFKQTRPGLNRNPFVLFKFRSMLDRLDTNQQPLSDALRLTRFGKILRATSMDELPELWNVLIGDMSLVGPRPLLMEYLPLYSAEQMRRHDVRPGITGWAQVQGRNALSWDEKFKLDVWYVEHKSFKLDILILLRTLTAVLFRQGITGDSHVTMPPFRGDISGKL
jgi:lipopolysaccharide/colanic/teichoic acid biosynthesis glycosyltransferase